MSDSPYRPELPPIPWRLRHRPVEKGWPVPWFCAEIDGHYDFRVMDGRKIAAAVQQKLCWICGKPLGNYLAFAIGPMCAITRTNSEPPSHRDCAEWSIRACPFLNQREQRRNTANLPEGYTEPAGLPIYRQPGVTTLWITKRFRMFEAENGVLFRVGDPLEVRWYCEGRPATRAEVLTSIEGGYPTLLEVAHAEGDEAVRDLERMLARVLVLLPAAEGISDAETTT